MIKQFKEFLTQSNALALAIGVIIGAATGKLVTGVVSDLLMPIITLILPAGDWREAQLVLKHATDAAGKETITAIKYGDLAGTALDFVIISYIVFLITKALLPKKNEPAMKDCPECLEKIPAAAKKCKFCTSPV
ncbi:MAG: large conductance mechanosensitive channel protein MscL [Bacteroidota bacterium]|nr:large conductance mechanosensitive channel protein MscL [Bacteroidota bacterium]MDP4233179.1 large conductance mechanosensitive channel protein MscL [Bacteroidota bacterium]MDP4242202.1 large conductance mechanosensitive channel protein MscL [Bacteroidota bacterium]MDP4289406.1 large conductance mechanosensitive channel protein MscL [Bacteroidota bacterium]